MDPLSIVAGSTQIATHCGQCIVSITKWIYRVKTVDQRLTDFRDEVCALEQTYKSLKTDFKKPSLIEAAREADSGCGGCLWKQVDATLRDCEGTLSAMKDVLDDIDKVPRGFRGLLSPVMRQLNESVTSGDLSRLRARLPVFNSTLVASMQMINITLQLQQQNMSMTNHKELSDTIGDLRQSVQYLTSAILQRPHQAKLSDASTQVNNIAIESTFYVNIENYARTARAFLSSASATATERSGTSTILGRPLTITGEAQINDWVHLTGREEHEEHEHATLSDRAECLKYDEIDLTLTQQYLHNAQLDMSCNDFVSAEANFCAALDMLDQNVFGENISYSQLEIQLMLSECCLKQQKYDETIQKLLLVMEETPPCDSESNTLTAPPAARSLQTSTEKGLKLTACHILADAYLQKREFNDAERYGNQVFWGRKDLLQLSNPKMVESVELLIKIHESSGNAIKARAYRCFLQPQA